MPAGWVSAAGWALVGFAACYTLSGLEPNLVEEGLVLHVAQRLAAGADDRDRGEQDGRVAT